jgi:SAM-dependent methyltransferase
MRSLDSYKKLCTEFYDLDKPVPPPDAFDFYWRRYEAAGGPVLEAMCGSGRFLLPFAERGADIDGVDASPEMLEACRVKAEARGLRLHLYLQFLQELTLPRRYRFAFVPAGSFVLIPSDDHDAALRRLAAHLLPGAELIVEMITPGGDIDGAAGPVAERRVSRPDGSEIVLTVAGGRHRYDLVHHGEVLESEFESYGWAPRSLFEFQAMLANAGFDAIQAWEPYTEKPASEGDDRTIVYVCRRAPG